MCMWIVCWSIHGLEDTDFLYRVDYSPSFVWFLPIYIRYFKLMVSFLYFINQYGWSLWFSARCVSMLFHSNVAAAAIKIIIRIKSQIVDFNFYGCGCIVRLFQMDRELILLSFDVCFPVGSRWQGWKHKSGEYQFFCESRTDRKIVSVGVPTGKFYFPVLSLS